MPAKARPSARHRILEAAEQVIRDVGAANLTLDAVAAAAGVSKGGLLYHFASKEALLKGMVDHHLDMHEAVLAKARTRHPDTPAGYLRAYIEAQIECAKDEAHEPAAARSFLAAAANFPALLERPRHYERRHFEELRKAGVAFPRAAAVSLALDGLFFCEVFELCSMTADERAQVVEELVRMAGDLPGA